MGEGSCVCRYMSLSLKVLVASFVPDGARPEEFAR